MELGITIPLQRYLNHPKPPYGTQCNLHLCWDLHVLTPNGKASLLAVHASSRYAFLLYCVSALQWQTLPELFCTALRQCFDREDISVPQQAQYFQAAGPALLTKTHGRRPVAFLNRAVDDLYSLPIQWDDSLLLQPDVLQYLNDIPCRAASHEGRDTARHMLCREFSNTYGGK